MRTPPAAGERKAAQSLRFRPRGLLIALAALLTVGLPGFAASTPASAGSLVLPKLSLTPAATVLGGALAPLSAALAPVTAGLTPVPAGLAPILKPSAPATGPVATAPSAPSTAPDLRAPLVVAAQSGDLPDITVRWLFAMAGAQATGAVVQLDRTSGTSPGVVSQIRCGACTSTTFRELAFGSTYVARVYPTDVAGEGAPTASAPVTLATSCTVGACVGLDATSRIGPVTHAASGLLNSLQPVGNDLADAKALGVTTFRSAPGAYANNTYDWSNFGVATTAGAQTIVMLDALWKVDHGGVAPTPWSNWAAYSQWMSSTVTSLLASGKPIDYWDIYNEPGGANGYYGSAAYATETPTLLLQQFLVAYRAIKAADPAARVVGPDLEYWSDYPGQYGPDARTFDMATFLNFATANGIKLAAITWHEIVDNVGPNPEENTVLPATLDDHVAQARALVAAHPSLGDPKIFITEYGMPEAQKIPGWDVGYLAALTNAGVDEASRACWDGDCGAPDLDGLLSSNGKSPLPDYYARLVYAAMSGDMIRATSTSDTVAALGSYNARTGTVTALIGRGVSCSESLQVCPSAGPGSAPGSPVEVNVTITVPWSSGTVQTALTRISGSLPFLPASGPRQLFSGEKITPDGAGKGIVTVTIPTFNDGDAYGLSISH